ncbi:MAG: sugar phosphate isomerase/epimerase [Limnochordales bacterium]|nr:sugar phosphate isomerase/epimerase [Limnochordales bacterium]
MPVEIGIQSYTFRKFDIRTVADKLQQLGVQAAEVWDGHLPASTPPAEVESILAHFRSRGLRVCGFGVVWLRDPESARQLVQFAARLGADYLSVDFRPDDRETQQAAVAEAQEAGICLALHNHGPGHHFGSSERVWQAVSGYPREMGACVDTGHYLRSGEDPVAVIEHLGERVHAVHLKDFVDERKEVSPGTGRLDLPAVVAALRKQGFAGTYVIEYEADPENPSPTLEPVVARLRELLGQE